MAIMARGLPGTGSTGPHGRGRLGTEGETFGPRRLHIPARPRACSVPTEPFRQRKSLQSRRVLDLGSVFSARNSPRKKLGPHNPRDGFGTGPRLRPKTLPEWVGGLGACGARHPGFFERRQDPGMGSAGLGVPWAHPPSMCVTVSPLYPPTPPPSRTPAERTRTIVREFVDHDNNVRLHSDIGFMTQRQKLKGQELQILAERDRKRGAAGENRRKCHTGILEPEAG